MMDRARIQDGVRRMRLEDVLGRTERCELSQMEAAELLGVSERTFRRWRDRYREEVPSGLADRRPRHARMRTVQEAWRSWAILPGCQTRLGPRKNSFVPTSVNSAMHGVMNSSMARCRPRCADPCSRENRGRAHRSVDRPHDRQRRLLSRVREWRGTGESATAECSHSRRDDSMQRSAARAF